MISIKVDRNFYLFIFNLLKKNTISVKLLIISRRGGHVERATPYHDPKRMTLASCPQIFIENALRLQLEMPFYQKDVITTFKLLY